MEMRWTRGDFIGSVNDQLVQYGDDHTEVADLFTYWLLLLFLCLTVLGPKWSLYYIYKYRIKYVRANNMETPFWLT